MVAYGSTPAVDPTNAWNSKQYTRKEKGMTREERRQSHNATKRNARPRTEQPAIVPMSAHKSNVWESVLSPIYKALDNALIGKAVYPDKPEAAPLYAIGEHLTISANGQDYRVTVKQAMYVMGFIRYILTLDDHEAELSNVTEAQLVQVVKPMTAIIPIESAPRTMRELPFSVQAQIAAALEARDRVNALRRKPVEWEGTLAGMLDDNHPAWGMSAAGY